MPHIESISWCNRGQSYWIFNVWEKWIMGERMGTETKALLKIKDKA